MSAAPDSIAAALAELVGRLRQEGLRDDPQGRTVIVQGAVGMIRGAELAGMVVPGDSAVLEELAARRPVPPLVVKGQNIVQDGPCVDAVGQPTHIVIRDLLVEQRWSRFVQQGQRGDCAACCAPRCCSIGPAHHPPHKHAKQQQNILPDPAFEVLVRASHTATPECVRYVSC